MIFNSLLYAKILARVPWEKNQSFVKSPYKNARNPLVLMEICRKSSNMRDSVGFLRNQRMSKQMPPLFRIWAGFTYLPVCSSSFALSCASDLFIEGLPISG